MPDMPGKTSNFSDIEKKRLIKKEIARLRKICAAMDDDHLSAARGLIEEAGFMAVTLLDLRMTINREGCTSTYQNGENQWGTKKSPEIEVYNILIKNYLQVMKQLADLLPSAVPPDDAKEIAAFLAGAK